MMLDPTILDAYNKCQTTNVNLEEQGRFFNFRWGMQRPSADGMKAGGLVADVRSGCTTSSVHRARFLGELSKLLPEEMASFGKRVVQIEEVGVGKKRKLACGDGEGTGEAGVVLWFADGTTARHDAVVGCDGIKSQVRKLMLGWGGKRDRASEPVFSGKYCYRGLVPAEKAVEILGEEMATESQMCEYHCLFQQLGGISGMTLTRVTDLGNHGHVLTTLIEHSKTVNVVAYTTQEDGIWPHGEWVKPGTRDEMLAQFEGWSEPVLKILGLLEKLNMWALFDHLPARTFHRKGKICLLGDAAHASTPHHGAGAGMAVEDAFVLTKLLSSIDSARDLEAVLTAYDAVRRPRSQRLVASSRRIARIYDLEDRVVGDDMEAMGECLEHAWDWIWKEDLHGQLATAESVLRRRQRSTTDQEGVL